MTKIFTIYFLFFAAANLTFIGTDFPTSKENKNTFFAEIPINLSAKDKHSNIQLRPKFTIISVANNSVLPLKETDGRFTVMLKTGESYKIIAELEGYHTKEKNQTISADQDKDGFNVVLDMEPQPSATLILKAIDDSSGEVVDATFKITANGKEYSGKTSKEVPYFRVVLTKADIYQIDVTTNAHKPKKERYAIEVGEPTRSYNKEIRLEKPENGVKITIVDYDTGKILKGASLSIMNISDNILFFENLLPQGEAVVELSPSKKYVATVEFPGYTTLKVDLKATNQKEYTIKLPSETYVSIGAYDKLSGKRLPANFKITYKDNPPQEITGTIDADIKYKPTEKGLYQIEVSLKNYGTKKETLNLENLTAGKVQFKIVLESTVDDYVILVVDAEDKQMIPNADVKIFDENKEPIEVKLNPKTGEYKIELQKNKDYFLQIEAKEYMKQTGTLERSKSKLIGINMVKVFQSVYFSAIDGITKKPINANYKLIRPEQETLLGISDANRQFKVDLQPKKSVVIEISADGYKTVSENLLFSTVKVDKDGSKIVELQKDAYTFAFKVLDAQKKQAISNPKIVVLNLNTSQPATTTLDKTGFITNLIPANNYTITVEAEGFEKSELNINAKDLIISNKFEQEILLLKNSVERYKYNVVDEDKGSNVVNANLRIFNSANEPIVITANPLAAEWLAELKNEESYTVEIKADGYLAFRGSLPKNAGNKTAKLKIKKVPTEEIIFESVDALSKKAIVAEYKITTGGEMINGAVTAGGTKLKATLSQDKSYELEIIANGYKKYKDVINLSKSTNGTIQIELKKDSYSFSFKPVDSKNKQPVPNVKVKLLDSDKQSITTKFEIASQDFQVNLSPEKTYSIEVEASGYELFGEQINVVSLATNAEFKRDLVMTKKEVEKKPEPVKVEPIIVEKKPEPVKDIPKVVEKKPEPTKKIEVVVTDNKPVEKKPEPILEPKPVKVPEKKEPVKMYDDKATIITEEDFNVKIDVFESLAIGKRFRLSNLYFDQSSTKIKDQSFGQLDKLVKTMKLNPKMKIEIIGYTDNNGDPRRNEDLSYFRANVVSNYLFNKGVAANRIKVIGMGQEEPIAPNDTEENRIKNRRVEFVITAN